MSDTKLVNMSVPMPKKERRSRKQRIESSVGETVRVKTPTIPVEQTGGNKKAPLLVMSQEYKQKAGQPLPILSSTSVVGGDVKNSNSRKQPLSVPISNNKPQAYNESSNAQTPKPAIAEPKPVKINTTKKPQNNANTRKTTPLKVNIVPLKRPNKTLKKNFTAKRITIHMENSSKVRKTRDAVRLKVANMKLPEITKSLRDRGLIRETANPPESIQRSMMIDILLFPAPM